MYAFFYDISNIVKRYNESVSEIRCADGGNAADAMVVTSPVGTAYPWDGSPYAAVREGVNIANGAVPGSITNFQTVGLRPTQSRLFTDYFHIDKEQEIELSVGGCHVYEFNKKFDRVVDSTFYTNTPYISLMGMTEYFLMSVEGCAVVRDTFGTVTSSPPSVGYTFAYRYRATTALAQQTNFSEVQGIIPISGTVNTMSINGTVIPVVST